MSKPLVTAVIVTYQSRDTVGAALDALREAHDAGLAGAVVVDNASSDGTADFIAEQYPWVTLVSSQANLGFGRGCNLGFESVTTPYVFLINPDAVVPVSAIESLVRFMEQHPKAGIAAPATVLGTDRHQDVGLMTTPGSMLRAAFGVGGKPMPDQRPVVPGEAPFRTSWVCGAAMLIRCSLYQSLGGFDPRFFLYFEETDLCRRATAAGAEVWAVGEAVAHHVGGASAKSTGDSIESSCIAEHYYRSRFYYLVKHFGWMRAALTESLVRIAQHARNLRHWLRGRAPAPGPGRTGRRPFLQFPSQPMDSASGRAEVNEPV